MTLQPGQTLSQYRLVEKIGEGGMGVVWKAVDTSLDREVAIKVLPAALSAEPERLSRFEREAKLLASLSHSNIAAIHGFEAAQETRFIVLELVQGRNLADMVRSGPPPLDEALAIAHQIAAGLEAAHAAGVIHRDLKPANIHVTPQGEAKVLDFGLAKALDPEGAPGDATSQSMSPTLTVAATQQGVILGTASYMSPEQARGKPLDRRTDIWSFGCVLFELLAGKQAFQGETVSDTLAKILEREPDWSALPDQVPPRVRDLLQRCLRRDPRKRLQDMGDARIQIEEALEEGPAATDLKAPPPAAGIPIRTAALAAIAFALAATLITWLVAGSGPAAPETDLQVGQVARLTHDPGLSEWPTWSPDGSLLAFAADRSGNFEILLRRVDGGHEVNVTDDPGQDFQPAFSPDGNRIAFISTRSSRTGMIKIGSRFGMEFRTLGGDLWTIPALGGQARRLAPDANYPVWHPDGDRIAYVSGSEQHRTIQEVAADGGSERAILPAEASVWEIVRLQYSPSGRWISFEALNGMVYLMPAEGGEPRELFRATNHVWDASGERIYFLSRDRLGGTRLQVVNVDETGGRITGEPRSFGLMTGILRDLAIARDGKQMAVSELEGSLNLTLLPLAAGGGGPDGPEKILSRGQVIDRYPQFSPDGKRIAYSSDRLGPMEIWILDVETGVQQPLDLPGPDLGANLAYWSPDGRQLALTRFISDEGASLWLTAADGSQAEELLPPTPGLSNGAFSPDGRSLLYAAIVGDYNQLFVLDLESRESRQLTDSPWDTFDGQWSPDGESIVVISNRSGAVQAWRIPARGGEPEPVTTGDERVRHAFYSPDGRWVFYQPSHRNVYRVPVGGGDDQAVTEFPESGLFIEEPALSPDGRHLAYCRSNGGSSLWLLTLGETTAGP